MPKSTCSPGGHPHSDRPNWRPATTADDYIRNCAEGLEAFSERRFAKIMNWPRISVWRARMMAEVPFDLFEKLLDAGIGGRQIAELGAILSGASPAPQIERCRHCGGVTRIRGALTDDVLKVVDQWLRGAQ